MEARVPRYFFNVHDGRCEIDTEGTELADQNAARLMGVQLAGEILKDEGHRQMLGDTWHLEPVPRRLRQVSRWRVDG